MGVALVGLVHRDPCECKIKGFHAVSSIERNVSKRRHLQGVRQELCTKIRQADATVAGTTTWRHYSCARQRDSWR